MIRRGTVRASAPAPHTPIEREAFRALVAQHTAPEAAGAKSEAFIGAIVGLAGVSVGRDECRT